MLSPEFPATNNETAGLSLIGILSPDSPSTIRFVTIQLTSDLSDSGVKSAHIHLYIARFILGLEQIRGNLNSYE